MKKISVALGDYPHVRALLGGDIPVGGFEVESVTRDGEIDHWTLEGMVNGVRVRIGRADLTLPTGQHEYVIRYRTTRQIGFFPDYDELYWNATGNGWSGEKRIVPLRV